VVGRVLNEKTIGEGKSWMSVELRERKWCGVLGIEKVGVECCWMVLTIVNGLRLSIWTCHLQMLMINHSIWSQGVALCFCN